MSKNGKPFYRYGRRASVLATLGLMWIIRAILLPYDPGRIIVDKAILFELYLPVTARIWAWFTFGLASVILSRSAKLQKYGWAIIMIMPIERTIGHAWSFFVWIIPGGVGGELISGLLALYWLGLSIGILIVSRWPEANISAYVMPAKIEVKEANGD